MGHVFFFDLDGTLLKTNISRAFGFFLLRRRILGVFDFLLVGAVYTLQRMDCISLDTLHRIAYKRFFFKMEINTLDRLVEEFLNLYFDGFLCSSACEFLNLAKKAVILSSSPSFLVGPVAKRLGIDRWQATEYDCGSVVSVIDGPAKVEAVQQILEQEGLGKESAWGFSDSHQDLPFLEAVGKPVAVNPNGRLKRIAKTRGWQIVMGE